MSEVSEAAFNLLQHCHFLMAGYQPESAEQAAEGGLDYSAGVIAALATTERAKDLLPVTR